MNKTFFLSYTPELLIGEGQLGLKGASQLAGGNITL